jgi:hypothetical protein
VFWRKLKHFLGSCPFFILFCSLNFIHLNLFPKKVLMNEKTE